MSDQNAFNRSSLDLPPMAEPQGLLEQFNLPPSMIKFLRDNSKIIWICIGCIATVVVAVSLFDSYRDYKINQAASALDFAMQSDQKESLLQKVVVDYSATPSSKWAKLELVKLNEQQGKLENASSLLTELDSTLSETSPIKPLITIKLADLYQKQNQMDKALGAYTVLAGIKGFEATAYKSMGLIHEGQGHKEQAVNMYRQYLEALKTNENPQSDPSKMMIESRLYSLEGN